MLELAILFLVISAVARPFGPAYADVASATLSIAGIFALAWFVAGLVTLVFRRPLDRRLLHHA